MARNGSGTYSLPAGNPVVSGTTIDVSWANPTMSDLATALSGSVAADGQTPMSAPLRLDSGTASAPGITFNAETTMGLFRPLTSVLGFSLSGTERMRLVAGNLLLNSTTDTGERLQVTGTTKLVGDTAITGTLGVSAAATLSTTLSVTGNTTVGGTLGVTGNTTLTGSLTPNSSVAFGANYTELSNAVTAAASTTINCALGNNFAVAMNASITTLTLSNVPATGRVYNLTLFLKQDATGSRLVTWPAAVKWTGGSAPTLTTTATKTDIITLITYDGGTVWHGCFALNF